MFLPLVTNFWLRETFQRNTTLQATDPVGRTEEVQVSSELYPPQSAVQDCSNLDLQIL